MLVAQKRRIDLMGLSSRGFDSRREPTAESRHQTTVPTAGLISPGRGFLGHTSQHLEQR